MGFGIPGIGDAVKSAVHHVSDAVGGAAKAVGEGLKAAEHKVAPASHGAWESIHGKDGFDHNGKGNTILVDSKPKGGSSAKANGGTVFV